MSRDQKSNMYVESGFRMEDHKFILINIVLLQAIGALVIPIMQSPFVYYQATRLDLRETFLARSPEVNWQSRKKSLLL